MNAGRRVIVGLSLLAAMGFACAGSSLVGRGHPETVERWPLCSDCHERAPYAAMDHTRVFLEDHRRVAGRGDDACRLCHRPSFCTDCHGYKEELRPVQKYPGAGSAAPHPAGYLVRHRVDGRLNPASCFGCHGRRNEWRCRQCHR